VSRGSALGVMVDEYVSLRLGLGFKCREEAPWLHDFARYLEQRGITHVTTAEAVRWATRPASAQPARWAARLRVVRRLALHLSSFDERTEVPPVGLLPFHPRRQSPYLYTDDQIRKLLVAARQLRARNGLRENGIRGKALVTFIGLLAVTGLRSGEAIALDDQDVDLQEGIITVREGKYRKSRLVPVQPSTCRALRDYVAVRDRVFRCRPTEAFFVGWNGDRLGLDTVQYTFRQLRRRAGVHADPGRRQPRLHDFRHRLAVRALIHWYRCGADVEHHLPTLSTYLGHVHIADTYWYLTAVPELLGLASDRLERQRGKG
jgi:integrase/recombinase XerD